MSRLGFFRSVRMRTTVAATVLVSIALFLAAIILLQNTVGALNQGALNLAKSELGEVELLLKNPEIPNPLPVPRGDLGVQILDSHDAVVASTSNFVGLKPVIKVSSKMNSITELSYLGRSVLGDRFGQDRYGAILGSRVLLSSPELRVVRFSNQATADLPSSNEISEQNVLTTFTFRNSKGILQTSTPSVFVVVWASLSSSDASTNAIEGSLLTLFPLLVILLGVLVWFLTGRALNPVEKIRSEVTRISGSNLDKRVHVPETDDEIAKLALTMNEMLDRIESSTKRMKRFVSDASHELRSPISSIRAELEVAQLHPEATDIPSALEAALTEAERMQRIVADLLTLAKIDENAIVPKFDSVDLDEIITAEVRRLRLHNGLTVDATHVSAARIQGDADQIFRIVRNLLENAARHADSKIMIQLGVNAEEVELRIADDGPGIPIELRDKIFERFHRVEEDRARASGGSGLGLAITASLVDLHKGEIFVSSDTNALGGAEFVIIFPADPAFLGIDIEFQPIHTYIR